jgi:hypothetical protein
VCVCTYVGGGGRIREQGGEWWYDREMEGERKGGKGNRGEDKRMR